MDGQTAGKNVQPGLLGEGWDYQPGFVERSYRACSDDATVAPYYTNATADQCWRLPNARLVWGGRSTELVTDDTTGFWHAADDDGLKVDKVTSDWARADMMFSPGDFDGDGKADLMYRRYSDQHLFLVRGDGAGGWLNAGASVDLGGFSAAASIFSHGDFDGDGKPDVLWRRTSDGTMWLIAGNGVGRWKTAVSVQIGIFASADLVFSPGDFDGDGKMDVLWRKAADGTLWLITGNGTGGWKTGTSTQIGTGWNSMDAIMSPGDFNGDGHSDVLVRNATSHILFMFKGNGTGGWISGTATQIMAGFATPDIVFSGGDHNGDGKADVLWRDPTSKDVNLLAGNGLGGWTTGTSVNITAAVRTGTGDDEYWKITTPDGTQYFFGRDRLPNWSAGKRETSAQWTVPVFANHINEPCFTTAGFASSWCSQAWRWNLDYVVDPHGNSMAYFYGRNQGKVALAGNAAAVATYDRGGWIDHIEYGMRAGSELATTTPPAKVVFTTAERCLTACWAGAAWTSAPTTANWPDTPWDIDCQAAPCTGNLSPTFWIPRRMASVSTQIWSGTGTTYNNVDQWDLAHQFPSTGNGTSPVLWLASITHTGQVNGGSVAMPAVTFGGTRFDQRADYDPNATMAQPRKYRITTVDTETGGELAVAYSGQDPGCQFGSPFPAPDQNTKRCFPQYFKPQLAPPAFGWWHKYIVTSVTEKDLTGGSPDILHSYAYGFSSANASASTAVLWHQDTGGSVWAASLAFRSFGDWRGYPIVTITTGPVGGTQSQTENVYFRGLDADRTNAGDGTRTSTITASGTVYTDNLGWAGRLLQTTSFAAPGGQALAQTIHAPARFQTASHVVPVAMASPYSFAAYINRTSVDTDKIWLAAGATWRTSSRTNTWDPTYGVITSVDDRANATDDNCTTYSYAYNTAAYLIDYPSRAQTVNVACGATPTFPTNAVTDTRYFYDSAATFGTAPAKGDVTRVENVATYTGQSPNYVMSSTGGYDVWGRPTSVGDALGRTSTTVYTQATNGLLTTVAVTNPATHVTTTTIDANRGQPLTFTDPNLKVTTGTYDALGRLLKVWLPGQSTGGTPNAEFVYTVNKTGGVNAIQTERLGPNGNQISAFDLYDGLLRPRQTQTTAPDGFRAIADTAYDGRGLTAKRSVFYNNASGPTSTLVSLRTRRWTRSIVTPMTVCVGEPLTRSGRPMSSHGRPRPPMTATASTSPRRSAAPRPAGLSTSVAGPRSCSNTTRPHRPARPMSPATPTIQPAG